MGARVNAAAPVLRVEGVEHRWGRRVALHGVSLHVASGEIVGLLGPNGSGKSTLLRIVAGTVRLQTGRVVFEGRPVVPRRDGAYRRRLAAVFQSPALDRKLTVEQNLRLAARLYGLTGEAAARRIDELLGGAGLGDRRDDAVGALSGGLRRRVDLARAWLSDPALLLLDEPTSGLDEHSFRSFWRAVSEQRRRTGMGVLVATHRSDEAERCDRLVVIDEGRVVAEDTPDGLRARVEADAIEVEVAEHAEPTGGVRGDINAIVAAAMRDVCGVEPERVDGRLVARCADGHKVLPRVLDALPAGAVRAVHLRRPDIADAFVALTGHALEGEEPVEAAS